MVAPNLTVKPRMKVVVDIDKCEGHGRCRLIYPAMFDVESEKVALLMDRVPVGGEKLAKHGALSCPERAISIVE